MVKNKKTAPPFQTAADAVEALQNQADPVDARESQRFFKTGVGEYGEGDVFIGVRIPAIRALATRCRDLTHADLVLLLRNPIHEARMLALLTMVLVSKQADETVRDQFFHLYLDNSAFVNNWDLVDLSAEHLVGAWLKERDRSVLVERARSSLLWDRRIAVLASFHFIKHHDFSTTLTLARLLIDDKEDLMHKAVGWMLREIGKRNIVVLDGYLKTCYTAMPRTMLRYAIEKHPESVRQAYLKGTLL